jgi:hypothetical protein
MHAPCWDSTHISLTPGVSSTSARLAARKSKQRLAWLVNYFGSLKAQELKTEAMA